MSKTPQYNTTLFWQKETGSAHVYGNAVIRAFYIPKDVIEQVQTDSHTTPEMITITIEEKTDVKA